MSEITNETNKTLANGYTLLMYGHLMAACRAARMALNSNAKPVRREDFYPLREVRTWDELLWTLNYVVGAYADRVEPRSKSGEKYMLVVSNVPVGHPVYLLATLFVLLVSGAEIHVRYSLEERDVYSLILDSLADQGLVRVFEPENPYSKEELAAYITGNKLENLVFLGDALNAHSTFSLLRKTGVTSAWYPSAHLLIADFHEEPVLTDKHHDFSDQCFCEVLDYSAYRAPTNEPEDTYLGFDFGDAFWGADAEVNTWNSLECIRSRFPAIIFSDRPREEVWLPKGIEKCCDVVFFEDYDCKYPLYDFLQIIR